MKKFLLAVLVLSLIAGAGFAQEAGTISAGAKLGGVIGFHDNEKVQAVVTPDSKFNFVAGIFGAYTIIDNLSVQAELNFMIGQGNEKSGTNLGANYEYEGTYNSLDIPILIKYSFLNDPLIVGVQAGPQLSIPLGKLESKFDAPAVSESEKYKADGSVTFGAVAGVYAGYPLGPGSIIGDIRFLFDFNALEVDADGSSRDALTRRGLVFSLGYGFSF